MTLPRHSLLTTCRGQGHGHRGQPSMQPEPAEATVGHACRPLQSSAHVSPCLAEPPLATSELSPGLDPGQAYSLFGPAGKVRVSLQPKPHQDDSQSPPGLGGQRGWGSPQENNPILQMRQLRPRQVRVTGSGGPAGRGELITPPTPPGGQQSLPGASEVVGWVPPTWSTWAH